MQKAILFLFLNQHGQKKVQKRLHLVNRLVKAFMMSNTNFINLSIKIHEGKKGKKENSQQDDGKSHIYQNNPSCRTLSIRYVSSLKVIKYRNVLLNVAGSCQIFNHLASNIHLLLTNLVEIRRQIKRSYHIITIITKGSWK